MQTKVVSCPRCRTSTRYDLKNPFRPFCSDRCKNEDIVAWAFEGYKIPGPPVIDAEDSEQLRTSDDEA